MAYKSEAELRARAESFIETLSKAGIEGAIMSDSFRDYAVKVSVGKAGRAYGHVNLYHSPKRDQFSLKTHELRDKEIVPELQAAWDVLEAPASVEQDGDSVPKQAWHIYVDGSYLDDGIGYGVVILQDGQPVEKMSGQVVDEALQGMRQVGGELQAVYKAIDWCLDHHVEDVALFYDYEGIEKWATGEWQAKNPATRAYAQAASSWQVQISWYKVQSHSGDRWNELADNLAKQGACEGNAASQGLQDPLGEARQMAEGFAKVLIQEHIPASYSGVLNDQFVRITVHDQGQQAYVDVYNTRKRTLSEPYLHGFSDDGLKQKIAELWRTYLGLADEKESAAQGVSLLHEATYYYEILRPYRDCAFDFRDLASALDQARQHLQQPGIDVESNRYDFGRLEAIYFTLKGEAKTS